jgi:AbrB family looped-hinge helix DNA binding protein
MPVTASEKGWVVIPADLRKKYNLRPGAKVSVVDCGGVLALVPAMARPVRQAAGMLKGRTSRPCAARRAQERAFAWPIVRRPMFSIASRCWSTSRERQGWRESDRSLRGQRRSATPCTCH